MKLGCTHPQRCLETARKLLDALASRWRPSAPTTSVDNVPAIPIQRSEDTEVGVLVNTAREAMNLRDSIRIFTEQGRMLEATSLPTEDASKQLRTDLVVYTDGSCIDNGTDEAWAGSGVWYGDNDPRNAAL